MLSAQMRKKYLLGASLIAAVFFSLISSLLVTSGAASQKLVIDGRDRERSTIKPTTTFKFFAENICNEDIGKNGLCLNIWGSGGVSANVISAHGGFETYRGKQVDLNRVERLSRGVWSAVDMFAVTDKQISFKAVTSTKIVFVELTEGELEKSGQVCIYGPLMAIQDAENAVCVDKALVVIEPR
jgi:hypothetical protein